ncbi:MAG: methyltransferase domain-containing protein [Saprospiraceae bacterium]|nr:methyltransferase domain-containing protein [Saprospiraceae bacterium]
MKQYNHRHWLKAYYDKNTILFNKFGKVGRTSNIHASIWKEGITDSFSASNYSNQLILDAIRNYPIKCPSILDLGCGLGGSLIYISERTDISCTLTGITLSSYQAKKALARIKSEISTRIDIHQGDFHELPKSWEASFDIAYAIESFVHSDDPTSFLREVARVLKPGGLLLLIDTFPKVTHDFPIVAEYINDYRNHWGAGNTLSPEELFRIAQDLGINPAHDEDLTKYLPSDRRRDHWIGMLNKMFRPILRYHVYLQSLRGGHAVQMGFKQGWLRYRFLRLIKSEL